MHNFLDMTALMQEDMLIRSLNIVRVIKSRRLRWEDHVATMEEGRSAFKILTGKPTERPPHWFRSQESTDRKSVV